jgi:hypothetical protein
LYNKYKKNIFAKNKEMVLKDIISISGESGLFKFIAQGKNSIIVEHLETKKRSSAFGSTKVNNLNDIAIFTEKEEMPLTEVFNLIFDSAAGEPVIDAKADNAQLKKWFEGVLPDYDKDRVYVSDIKKVALWYNTLQKLGLLVREEPEEKQDVAAEPAAEEPKEEPEKKPAKKKATSPKNKTK